MTSDSLHVLGIRNWITFSRVAKSDLLKKVPRTFGVYVIRKSTAVERVRGASDIVYVGSACNQRGLKGRLSQYFNPGPSQTTNKRIIEIIGESEEYQIGWCELVAKSDALAFKRRLLERFVEEHGERPPQNLKG